jgi:hypothetical protein
MKVAAAKAQHCAPCELQITANYDLPAIAQRLSQSRKEADPENLRSQRSDLQYSPVISH